jgi:hypothetical protein
MSDTKRESLAALLSPAREGMKLVNVKFFRGERELIRADEFRAQLRAIAEQRMNGAEAAALPKSANAKVDVRKFVADM